MKLMFHLASPHRVQKTQPCLHALFFTFMVEFMLNLNFCWRIYLGVCVCRAWVCVGVLIMFTSALNCALIRCTIPSQRQVLGRVTPEISGKIYSVVSNSFHRYTLYFLWLF